MTTNVIESDLAIVSRALDPRNRDKLVRVHGRVRPIVYGDYLAYFVNGVAFYASANDGHAVWACEALGRPFIDRQGGADYERRFMPLADWRLQAMRIHAGEDEAIRLARARGAYQVHTYEAGVAPKTQIMRGKTEAEIIKAILERAKRLGW